MIARNFPINDLIGDDWIPAATVAPYGKGMIGTILLNIGERYLNARTFQNRELLGGVMKELFAPAVQVKGSHRVNVVLNKKDGKLLVNLINSNVHSNPKEYTFDEIPPVPALDIEITLAEAPKKVMLQPGNRELPPLLQGWRAEVLARQPGTLRHHCYRISKATGAIRASAVGCSPALLLPSADALMAAFTKITAV